MNYNFSKVKTHSIVKTWQGSWFIEDSLNLKVFVEFPIEIIKYLAHSSLTIYSLYEEYKFREFSIL